MYKEWKIGDGPKSAEDTQFPFSNWHLIYFSLSGEEADRIVEFVAQRHSGDNQGRDEGEEGKLR